MSRSLGMESIGYFSFFTAFQQFYPRLLLFQIVLLLLCKVDGMLIHLCPESEAKAKRLKLQHFMVRNGHHFLAL